MSPALLTPSLSELTPEGKLRLHFHPGQAQAWQSERRTVCILAGTQGGKTVFGPPWLWREMKLVGPGDYLVVAPTYPLLNLKALPEFLKFFRRLLRLGDYVGNPTRCFTLSVSGALQTFGQVPTEPTHVYFGHASDPDSLEAATAKAAWLDEAGQKKFKLDSLEALDRRLSIHRGRKLITTTPYNLGWLKQRIYDPWRAGDPSIEVIRFDSTLNPAFPAEEFERARAELPAWKFDLFYRALFTRPAGLIYDTFDERLHKVPPFAVPADWPRHLGLDFGGINTAGVFLAEELGHQKKPTGRFFIYREYHKGGRTAAEHAAELKRGEPALPQCVGGSKSEGQWRSEFRQGGLPVREPIISDVEVGIDRVHAAFKAGQLLVFSSLSGLLEELATYSRELDERGEPTEEIEDKELFHRLDALRYIVSWIKQVRPKGFAPQVLGGAV